MYTIEAEENIQQKTESRTYRNKLLVYGDTRIYTSRPYIHIFIGIH